jgi:hydroxymethylpyrimidine pyrophosphatase-like HAD family hydrolase
MYTIAFDVDGTLIDKDDKPRKEVIALLRALANGNEIIVWSGGGKSYADMWVNRLNLGEFVYQTASKIGIAQKDIDLAIDDQDVKLGLYNIKL